MQWGEREVGEGGEVWRGRSGAEEVREEHDVACLVLVEIKLVSVVQWFESI